MSLQEKADGNSLPSNDVNNDKLAFDNAAEILDLCCMQLASITQDMEGSTENLTEIFFSISNSVKNIKTNEHSCQMNVDECDSIKQDINQLTTAYQANDEFCQRISHLQNTFSTLALFLRSSVLKKMEAEWDVLHKSVVDNRSIQRQHNVFQAAVVGQELSKLSASKEDSYELF